MKNLIELFSELNDLNIKYVVINNWIGLPTNPPKEIQILCDNLSQFVRSSGLSKLIDNLYSFIPDGLDESSQQLFRLYEKGNNLFTQIFEDELLSFPNQNNGVKTPPSDKAFWIAMYMIRFHHEDLNKNTTYLEVIKNAMECRMGPIKKPSYRDLSEHFTF